MGQPIKGSDANETTITEGTPWDKLDQVPAFVRAYFPAWRVPDHLKLPGHLLMQSVVEEMGTDTDAPTSLPTVAEQAPLIRLVQSCPYRTVEGCGCQGALCRAKKGDFEGGKVSSVQNCLACVGDPDSPPNQA